MTFNGIKYFLVTCIVVVLFFKASDVLSYSRFIVNHVEYSISTDDNVEQDQKKMETEYFSEKLLSLAQDRLLVGRCEKMVAPDYFTKLTYFPEVLTPPPLV